MIPDPDPTLQKTRIRNSGNAYLSQGQLEVGEGEPGEDQVQHW